MLVRVVFSLNFFYFNIFHNRENYTNTHEKENIISIFSSEDCIIYICTYLYMRTI